MNQCTKIRDVLEQKGEYSGWFYLPPQPWLLDTEGIFVKRDKDADPASDEHIPEVVTRNNWEPALDAAGIEDIIFNANQQVDDPSLEHLLAALIFYVDNDAFLDFSKFSTLRSAHQFVRTSQLS